MKVLIGVPNTGEIPSETVESLLYLRQPCECHVKLVTGSLVYTARDNLSIIAVNHQFDYLLFIDSDMVFPKSALERLIEHDADIVTGMCTTKHSPYNPCVYRKIGQRGETEAFAEHETDVFRDYFEIAGCGMAFCLIKVSVLKELFKTSRSCFEPLPGLGEDLSFCLRATQRGFKIYCDGTLKIGHIGKRIASIDDYRKELEKKC